MLDPEAQPLTSRYEPATCKRSVVILPEKKETAARVSCNAGLRSRNASTLCADLVFYDVSIFLSAPLCERSLGR